MKKSLKRLSILCLSLLTCATIGVAAGCDGFEATQSGYQQGIECLQGNHIWDVQVAVDGHQSVCTHCGTTKEVEPHFGGEATCTDKAVCDGCGEAYGETLEHDHATLNHNEEAHWYECECGHKETVEEHRGGNATCTEKAKCADCGVEYGETLPHAYDTLKHNSDVHWYECACGDKSEINAHFGGEATYNQKAVCELCGEEYGEFADANAYTLTILNYAPLAAEQKNMAVSVAEGEAVTVEAPAAIAGLIFKGYVAEDGSAATLPQTMPSENVTLTAVWEVVPYTVTFVYPEHYAGEKMTTITFGVMKDEANGITVTASEAATLVSEWAEEFDYETEAYAFAIANADAIPAELAAQNYEYEVVETVKEFTATVTLANGSKSKISYNINNKEEKLAEIQALLPENTAEYSYAWAKEPTELPLANCTFTIKQTTNNYQVIVRDENNGQLKSVKINVNNYKTVENEINGLLDKDTAAYNYTWKTWVGTGAAETGLEKVVLTLDLDNLGKTQYFQIVKEEIKYTVTVKHGYGNPHPQEKALVFTTSTMKDVEQQVEDMLPENSEICTYFWKETGTRDVTLTLQEGLVFTMARNPVTFTLTVKDLTGATTTYNYNLVDDKTSNLNSVNVQNTINGKLPKDTKQHTYTWAETGTRTIDLTKGSTFTMVETATVYTATVYVTTNEYDVTTTVKYGAFEYTVDTLTEVAAEIDELLTENNKYYSYVWAQTSNRDSVASFLTKQINNGKKTFDLKMTATLNKYTATVEYAYGTQADAVVEFTAKTLAAAQEQVLALLPENDEYYTYAWNKEVKLELCNSIYAISRTPIEYTAYINTMNGQQAFTYTVENVEEVEAQINELLLPEEDGYVYVWTDGVNFYTEIALPFGAGEACTFTMVKQTATYKAIVHYPNGGATLHMFTAESMANVQEYINNLLEADNEQYTYTWQNGTREVELTYADSEWTIVKTAVNYKATIYTFTDVKPYTFNADNKAEIEAEINALKPANNQVYDFSWQNNGAPVDEVELTYTNAENVNVFVLIREAHKYTATIHYAYGEPDVKVKFTADERVTAEQTIALMLPANDAAYTYNWKDNQVIALTLEDCEFTIERTAVEYTATVIDEQGLVYEYPFDVESMEFFEFLINSMLPVNDAAYTYVWAETGTEEVELTLADSTWTMLATAVEYTATVVDCDGVVYKYTFTVETMAEVEAKVEALLPVDTDAYTYTWVEAEEVELTLADSTWTMVQTAVPYKATVVDLNGKETEQWFTVETMEVVEKKIVLPADTAAYTYVWKETGTREVELTLADSTWTMVQTAVEYTATVVDYEGNATTYDFTTETMAAVEAEIEALLPENTAAYTYVWAEEVVLTLADSTWTMVRTANIYTATAYLADNKEVALTFTVETMETVEARLNELLPVDTLEYTYVWTETNDRNATLTLADSEWHLGLKLPEYKVDVITLDACWNFVFTTRTIASMQAEINAMLPADTAAYTYVWAETGTREAVLTFANSTWTVKQTAVAYTATVVDYEGNEVEVPFTTETMATKQAEINAMLPVDTLEYTYVWAETGTREVELTLANSTWTMVKTAVVYTAYVNYEDGRQNDFTFTVETMKGVEDSIKALLRPANEEYTYVWDKEVVLALEDGLTFTMVPVAVKYTADVITLEACWNFVFTTENKAEIEARINKMLPVDTAAYTYVWAENDTRTATLTFANSVWTVEQTAVPYKATVVDVEGKETAYWFTVETMAEVEAEIKALLPKDTAEYTYVWAENATREVELTLADSTWTMVPTPVEYNAAVITAGPVGQCIPFTFTVENKAEVEKQIMMKLPFSSPAYNYTWDKEIKLELTNDVDVNTFTVVKTANEYTATVYFFHKTVDSEKLEVTYTVENMAEKEAEIEAMLPANTLAYTYAWDKEVALTLANGHEFTIVRTANKGTITVVDLDENTTAYEFDVETYADVEARINDLLPEDKADYSYTWAETGNRIIDLNKGTTFTMVKTANAYAATVVYVDGKVTAHWFTVETLETVETEIEELLLKDTAEYTYVWAETGTREVELTLADSTWTMVQTAVEYTAGAITLDACWNFTFTVETIEETVAKINSKLPRNTVAYTYAWDKEVKLELTNEVGVNEFTVVQTAVEYTAGAITLDACWNFTFTVETIEETVAKINSKLPRNTVAYTYAWDKEVKLELTAEVGVNEFTVVPTPVEYTARVFYYNYEPTQEEFLAYTFTVETAEKVVAEIEALLPANTLAYTYEWNKAVALELTAQEGVNDFVIVRTANKGTITVVDLNGAEKTYEFDVETYAEVEDEINASLYAAAKEGYTYTWKETGTDVIDLNVGFTFTMVETVVEYNAAVITAGPVGQCIPFTFTVENRAEVEKQIMMKLPFSTPAYSYTWDKEIKLELTDELGVNTFTVVKTANEYRADVITAGLKGQCLIFYFTVENMAEVEAEMQSKLNEDTAAYSYTWDKPVELKLVDGLVFTVIETANAYMATVVDVEGKETEYWFTVVTMADVEAEIEALLPSNTNEYTYAWAEEPALTLADSTWTMVRTAVEYVATVNYPAAHIAAEPQTKHPFTTETKDVVLAEILACLPENTDAYTFAWAVEPTALVCEEGKNEFTIVATAVEYTATVVDYEGNTEEVKFTTETLEVAEEVIKAKLPENTPAYTYTWAEEPALTLADSTWTMVQTAVEYTAMVVMGGPVGGLCIPFTFTVENKAEVEMAIMFKLPFSTPAYTYTWDKEIKLELTNEEGVNVFTVVETANEYTATVITAGPVGQCIPFTFTVETMEEVETAIMFKLPFSTPAYTYTWDKEIKLELTDAEGVNEFTVVQTPVPYKAIVTDLNGKVTEYWFNVEKMAEVAAEIDATLPADSNDYIYGWVESSTEDTISRNVKLDLEDSVWTMKATAIEYVAIVNYPAECYPGHALQTKHPFNAVTMESALAAIKACKPADTAAYTFTWAEEPALVLEEGKNEFTIVATANVYTATVVDYEGNEKTYDFTTLTMEAVEDEIKDLLPENTAAYTYAWDKEVVLALEEGLTFTMIQTIVEYTVDVITMDACWNLKFTTLTMANVQAQIERMLPRNTAAYTYAWDKEVELQLVNGLVFTVVQTAVEYKVDAITMEACWNFTFTVENLEEIEGKIEALLPRNTAAYTYAWDKEVELELVNGLVFTVVETANEYTAIVNYPETVDQDADSAEYTFTVVTMAEVEAEIKALLPQDTEKYTYAWEKEPALTLADSEWTIVATPVTYKAIVNTLPGQLPDAVEVQFTVENMAEKQAEIQAMLPADTAAYTYAWAEAEEVELTLADSTWTMTQTPVDYEVKVIYLDGEKVYTMNIETSKAVFAEINATLPEDNNARDYFWKETNSEVAGPYDGMPLYNPVFTVAYTEIVYTATVIDAEGNEKTYPFSESTLNAVEAEIKALLTDPVMYKWSKEVALTLSDAEGINTFEVIDRYQTYVATIYGLEEYPNGHAVTFNEANKAEKEVEIEELLPVDNAEYLYVWAETESEEVTLELKDMTFTVKKVPQSYKVTVQRPDVEENKEFWFTVESKVNVIAEVNNFLANTYADTAEYTYVWAELGTKTIVDLELKDVTFTIIAKPTSSVETYTVTINGLATGVETVEFTVNSLTAVKAQVEAKLPAATPEYTYSFNEVLPNVFELKNYEFTVVTTVNVYEVVVTDYVGAVTTLKFAVEASEGVYAQAEIAAEVAKLLPTDTKWWDYAWTTELPATVEYQNYEVAYARTLKAVENALTVEEALQLGEEIGEDQTTTVYYYVIGIVKVITDPTTGVMTIEDNKGNILLINGVKDYADLTEKPEVGKEGQFYGAISNVNGAIEMKDAEYTALGNSDLDKVQWEMDHLIITEIGYGEMYPTEGQTYSEVKIEWDDTERKGNVVTLKATFSLGDVSRVKEYKITIL